MRFRQKTELCKDLILKSQELIDLILPVLRADVEMLNTIEYIEEEPLECSMSALGGLLIPE
jgi:medium-chain acyl-[acyl-carrier-protein] hydrolase